MAILWCGGEDIDFSYLSGYGPDSTAGTFRSGYARYSMGGAAAAGIAKSVQFSGISSGWLGCMAYFGDTVSGRCKIGFADLSTGKGIFVSGSATNKLAIAKWDGSSLSTLASEASTSASASLKKLDLQIINYNTASGTANLYYDRILLATYTGDMRISGITEFNSIIAKADGSGGRQSYSEIIIADADTRSFSMVTHYPNAAGDTLDWTGAYGNLDEETISDADLAYNNTDGNRALYNLSNLPTGSFSIIAVKAVVRALASADSSPKTLNLGIKSGTTVNVSDNKTLTTSWDTYSRLMSTNPCTGSPFTPTEVDALQIALESEA